MAANLQNLEVNFDIFMQIPSLNLVLALYHQVKSATVGIHIRLHGA